MSSQQNQSKGGAQPQGGMQTSYPINNMGANTAGGMGFSFGGQQGGPNQPYAGGTMGGYPAANTGSAPPGYHAANKFTFDDTQRIAQGGGSYGTGDQVMLKNSDPAAQAAQAQAFQARQDQNAQARWAQSSQGLAGIPYGSGQERTQANVMGMAPQFGVQRGPNPLQVQNPDGTMIHGDPMGGVGGMGGNGFATGEPMGGPFSLPGQQPPVLGGSLPGGTNARRGQQMPGLLNRGPNGMHGDPYLGLLGRRG